MRENSGDVFGVIWCRGRESSIEDASIWWAISAEWDNIDSKIADNKGKDIYEQFLEEGQNERVA